MEKITDVDGTLKIKENRTDDHIVITVIDEGMEFVILDEDLNRYLRLRWVAKDGYVGVFVNEAVEAVYSVKDKRIVDVNNNQKLRELYEFMLLSMRGFSTEEILTYLNGSDLGLIDSNEPSRIEAYLTSGNKEITRNQVVAYILDSYPQFKQYTNIGRNLSVVEFKRIKETLGGEIFFFNSMPQDLSFAEEQPNTNISMS